MKNSHNLKLSFTLIGSSGHEELTFVASCQKSFLSPVTDSLNEKLISL